MFWLPILFLLQVNLLIFQSPYDFFQFWKYRSRKKNQDCRLETVRSITRKYLECDEKFGYKNMSENMFWEFCKKLKKFVWI